MKGENERGLRRKLDADVYVVYEIAPMSRRTQPSGWKKRVLRTPLCNPPTCYVSIFIAGLH